MTVFFGLEDLLGGEGGIPRSLMGVDQDLGSPTEAIALHGPGLPSWAHGPLGHLTSSPLSLWDLFFGRRSHGLNPWSLVPLNGALTDKT